MLSQLTGRELALILNGQPELNIEEWQFYTTYTGYTCDSPVKNGRNRNASRNGNGIEVNTQAVQSCHVHARRQVHARLNRMDMPKLPEVATDTVQCSLSLNPHSFRIANCVVLAAGGKPGRC